MKLITIERARYDLRSDPEEDDYVFMLMEQASAIVLDYLKKYPAEWAGPENVPVHVQAATSLVMISLREQPDADPITVGVVSLLRRSRDPAWA